MGKGRRIYLSGARVSNRSSIDSSGLFKDNCPCHSITASLKAEVYFLSAKVPFLEQSYMRTWRSFGGECY